MPPAPQAAHKPPPPPFEVPTIFSIVNRTIAGVELFDTVGEAYRQDAFRMAVASGGSIRQFVTAQLVLDPGNPHDPDAVAVYLGKHHVSYIPRDRAPMWHGVIRALNADGHPAACHGLVVGARRGYSDEFGLVICATDVPRRLTADDPIITRPRGHGARINLTGEENSQEVLVAALRNGPGGVFDVSLWVGETGRVEAWQGTVKVGQLTAKMSDRYGALVQHLAGIGWPTTCTASVKPGKKKLEALLKLPKGEALTAACLDLGIRPLAE